MAFASKFADFRRIAIAQTAISSKMLAVGVDADPVENYDEDTKVHSERVNEKGALDERRTGDSYFRETTCR